MLNFIKQLLAWFSPFVIVGAIYWVIYVVRRLQGKAKAGDWKPRIVAFKPGEITSSQSDNDSDSSNSSPTTSSPESGGGSFGGGGASGQW
jgi:uncharacterized membrane protein YgcG